MIRILIVDDEKAICDLIDMNLSAAGYSCKTVQMRRKMYCGDVDDMIFVDDWFASDR